MTEEELYQREDIMHSINGNPVILIDHGGRIGNQWHNFKWQLNRLFENANKSSVDVTPTGRVSG